MPTSRKAIQAHHPGVGHERHGAIDCDGNDRIWTTTEVVQLAPEEQEKRKTTGIRPQAQVQAPRRPPPLTSAAPPAKSGPAMATTPPPHRHQRIHAGWRSNNNRRTVAMPPAQNRTQPGSEIRTSIAADGSRSRWCHLEEARPGSAQRAYDPDRHPRAVDDREYDEYARVTTRTTTDAEPCIRGARIRSTRPASSAAPGRITANTYNADGSVASTTVTVGDKS
ncbi:MAG: hypothetical protein R3F19_18655 [Verrucomicrobiales bacterium]